MLASNDGGATGRDGKFDAVLLDTETPNLGSAGVGKLPGCQELREPVGSFRLIPQSRVAGPSTSAVHRKDGSQMGAFPL